MYHRASLGHYLCFLAHFHLLSATNAFEVDFWILDFSFKDFWICAHFHFLSATNTFGGIWDLGFKSFMDMGFVIFSPVLPYVWRNAYGVEYWIWDLRFYGFLDLCFLAQLLPPRCTQLFHFDSKLEVMSLWLHYSNGLRGSISK